MMLLNISSANAVSYNMALAQSAAHVAHLRGCNVPNEALMFKQGAIKVLREWIEDPLLAYTDATANALFQLMTYEVCLFFVIFFFYPRSCYAGPGTCFFLLTNAIRRDTGVRRQSGDCIATACCR